MLKICNHSITTRKHAVTYYYNLEEVPRHLEQKNCVFLASGCWPAARNVVEVGGGGGVHRGLIRRGGVGNSEVGVTASGGGGNSGGGGSTVEGSSTYKNRSSHHKYKTTKQFELRGSKSTQCPLGAT